MDKKIYPFFYGKDKQHFAKAVVTRGFVFLSGVSGREFHTGKVRALDVKVQTDAAWRKVKSILDEVGATLNDVVKLVIYLRSARDYNRYYAATSEYLSVHCPELLADPPAVTLVEAGLYQEEMLVEIDVTAVIRD
jgi:2-iminobutanoate/2-iminopropanoate deaminase